MKLGTTAFVEVKACGAPLFHDVERELSVCKSCLKGWQSKGNEPTKTGLLQIASAREALVGIVFRPKAKAPAPK